jgi:hypothetical protein
MLRRLGLEDMDRAAAVRRAYFDHALPAEAVMGRCSTSSATARAGRALRPPGHLQARSAYTDGRPREAVETEALSQTLLVDILRGCLDDLLLEPLAMVQEREERERRSMRAMIARSR